MSKKTYFILFLLTIGLSSYYNFDSLVGDRTKNIFNNIKLIYLQKIESIEDSINLHFNQSEKIKNLTNENENLIKYKLLYTQLSNDYNNLGELKSESGDLKDVSTVSVLSYTKFDDFTNVYLDTHDLNMTEGKIGGLIIENYAAGIAIKKGDKSIGLLNGNKKANYAVFIGDIKAPGITHNIKYKKDIVVKFIPNWIEINIGDEVITSGMDNIFFEGLKVGKVKSIKQTGDTQEATVEPYADISNNSLYYLYYKK